MRLTDMEKLEAREKAAIAALVVACTSKRVRDEIVEQLTPEAVGMILASLQNHGWDKTAKKLMDSLDVDRV